jgi:hypothetical protein
MPEPLQLIIGGKEHERVEVALIGRECPESFDLYDGNWLEARVSVAVGAFRGEFSCTLRAQDFAELLPQLRRLHADLLGSARFSTMEGQLKFEIIGDGRGHLKVRGRVVDQPGDGTSLEWSLAIDQTFLPAMIEAVSAISTMYEVRGGGPSSSPQEPGIVAAALAAQRQQPPERPGHFLRSLRTIAAITVCLSSAWLLYGIAVELFIAWYSGAEADLGSMAWTTITAQVVVNLAAIVLALRVVRAAPPHHAAR